MKFVLSAFVALLFVSAPLMAQPDGGMLSLKKGPSFAWTEKSIDLGDIPQNIPVEVEFEFKNNGNSPLVISKVETQCGCTVPSWPEEPIMVGQSRTIKATYNAKASGIFAKTLSVYSNASEEPEKVVIEGKVIVANK